MTSGPPTAATRRLLPIVGVGLPAPHFASTVVHDRLLTTPSGRCARWKSDVQTPALRGRNSKRSAAGASPLQRGVMQLDWSVYAENEVA